MTKILLAAINAKYIHSNLGVYSLKAYAENVFRDREGLGEELEIQIGEYTINQQTEQILEDIYERQPDMVGFSCYIWNISYVRELIQDLHKVLPNTDIWLGGPEVSYDALRVLKKEPEVCGVMCGEGEEMFASLAVLYASKKERKDREESLGSILGLAYRKISGEVVQNPMGACLDMSKLPFSYHDLQEFENRIVYYESSRGCPFSCSYCLSSIDKRVRFRDLSLVRKELDFFLEKRVPQVKFVDRTFNCKKSHAMAIWRHILEHDNGVTNFHFEISADLLDEEELELLSQMRAGLVQLEIGVQSTNPDTIREIHRSMNLEKLKQTVSRINAFHNIHQHLDLIAGLPYENLERFSQSFDEVYAMEPNQLQLGFLKVLKGSFMMKNHKAYELCYQNSPPYEVFSTRWLSYADVLHLKGIEDMVEVYYNSRQFEKTIEKMLPLFEGAFAMYAALAAFYKKEGLKGLSHSRIARYELLYRFLCEKTEDERERSNFRDCLMTDLYLRENAKSRPSFAGRAIREDRREAVRDFFIQEEKQPRYLKNYAGYDSKQMAKMAHVECLEDGRVLLFDYKTRDVLNYNASCLDITEEIGE